MVDTLHLSVDLETTGFRPDRHGILEIGACFFTFPALDVQETFSIITKLPPTRDWALDTYKFHKAVGGSRLIEPKENGIEPLEALEEFSSWIGEKNKEGTLLEIWFRPSHFDFPFLDGYFDAYKIKKPFHYRHVKDVATFCWMRNPDFDAGAINFIGNKHVALDDARHNIRLMRAASGLE